MARTFAYCPYCQTLWFDVPGIEFSCQHMTLDVTAADGARFHRETVPVQVMRVTRVYGDQRAFIPTPEPVSLHPVRKP